MKELYTKPQVDIEVFAAVAVITTSSLDSEDDKRKPIELPDL